MLQLDGSSAWCLLKLAFHTFLDTVKLEFTKFVGFIRVFHPAFIESGLVNTLCSNSLIAWADLRIDAFMELIDLSVEVGPSFANLVFFFNIRCSVGIESFFDYHRFLFKFFFIAFELLFLSLASVVILDETSHLSFHKYFPLVFYTLIPFLVLHLQGAHAVVSGRLCSLAMVKCNSKILLNGRSN